MYFTGHTGILYWRHSGYQLAGTGEPPRILPVSQTKGKCGVLMHLLSKGGHAINGDGTVLVSTLQESAWFESQSQGLRMFSVSAVVCSWDAVFLPQFNSMQNGVKLSGAVVYVGVNGRLSLKVSPAIC
ncbi:unnamed protein product [Pleuronectes platessa]|uniref:Uncharacterized protein n=1 Tax=Pleuronectes platessa TaxID=8262 RepID=A0A9N7UHU9_PLEPL|nr:unnamed protein product [Pleuronectes platessa]